MADTARAASTKPGPGDASREASPASPAPASVLPGTGNLEADPNLEAGHDAGDNDSSLSVYGGISDTTSVASSIYKFREENGRTYHAYKASESEYWLPNDERENERLDLQHNVFIRMQDNQLYICPAGKDKPLKRVLDCGTGTGIWAMDFADEHPEATVIGVDLSPIQPTFVPPNVEFFVDDLETEWTFVNKFDFIYCRGLTGSIRDFPKLIGQAYRHLNPGGYIEMADPINPIDCDDGTMKEDSPILRWNTLLQEASEKLGAPLNSALKYKQQLIDAGFEDVVEVKYKWPLGPWPKDPKYKEVGQWTYANFITGLQGFSLMLFTKVLGWTVAQVEALLVEVRKEAKNPAVHGYWVVPVVYGRKPE